MSSDIPYYKSLEDSDTISKKKTNPHKNLVKTFSILVLFLSTGLILSYHLNANSNGDESNTYSKFHAQAKSRPIVIGNFKQTFHQVEGLAIDYVLRSRGYQTEFKVIADYEELFNSMFVTKEIDLIPSVWLPDGHDLYLSGYDRKLNKDYIMVGTTSEAGKFYWMASPKAFEKVQSIDDLIDPSKTEGLSMEIIQSAPKDAGLSVFSREIIENINSERLKKYPDAVEFTYDENFDEDAEKRMFRLLDNINEEDNAFIVTWYEPWWGVSTYQNKGPFQSMSNGVLGSKSFGRDNRGVTITTTDFAQSGLIDDTTWDVLQQVFLGNEAISEMDLYLKNNKDRSIYDAFDHVVLESDKYKYFFESYSNMNTKLSED